ncbi:hypothetical protein BU23DRAFT_560918 [Bimuria novae-zelandiae CBS 107.79]|uniref:Uncharacterized protein n=1 Tax=Bimuria novae-zelandiae CBS 107.79 TaxID=1447943 RepID=A0A6A5ULW0_9PLEO|nr:hypothetical protein BU23DRAFT_560918 [Bimuria novae-zelandiae CBS 107.79]
MKELGTLSRAKFNPRHPGPAHLHRRASRQESGPHPNHLQSPSRLAKRPTPLSSLRSAVGPPDATWRYPIPTVHFDRSRQPRQRKPEGSSQSSGLEAPISFV